MITVAIVTAKTVMRDRWQQAVGKMTGIRCLGVFSSSLALTRTENGLIPDLILLGVEPDEQRCACIKVLRESLPTAKILVLAATIRDEQLFSALRLGVDGYLQQSVVPTKLQLAIRELDQGGTPLSPAATQRIMASFRPQRRSDNLSQREQEVYQLLCDGSNYREIAAALFVSQNTVRFHLKNIYKKLGVKSRHEALARAYEAGER